MDNIEILKGETIVKIDGLTQYSERVVFTLQNGKSYVMYHSQDCCESVEVEDVIGDIDDLIGSPLLEAESVESNENPEGVTKEYQDSFTWTFYKLGTIKGHVTIRWYGESNGYYSESVTFCELGNEW